MNDPLPPDADDLLPPRLRSELDLLLSRALDGPLEESDRGRLNELLQQQQSARSRYLKLIALHSELTTTAGTQARAGVEEAVEQLEFLACSELTFGNPLADSPAVVSRSAARRGDWSRVAGLLAALACGAVLVWFGFYEPAADEGDAAVATASAETRSAASVDETDGKRDLAAQAVVARVSYVSSAVRWTAPNHSFALESAIREGQVLALEQGEIEMTYASGAKVLLTGPSQFSVRKEGGRLGRGELVARVTKRGHGFTIDTPHGKVVDLGTEFGVVVDDFGVSQVNVYEGRVETLPTGVAHAALRTIELTQGKALQLTGYSVQPMAARGKRYSRPNLETPDSRGGDAPAFDLQFIGGAAASRRLRSSGSVAPTPRGLALGADASDLAVPRLIALQQFDPSQGPLDVVCEVQFAKTAGSIGPSFAILTRCDDSPSKPGTPWKNMLASCVRCSLSGDSQSGSSLLRAGAKFEADREFANISWEGFAGLQPDTPYRLELHDDGLNIEFTVSLVANPAIRKTVKCRSLFRGDRNLIAFEGSPGTTTILERLRIAQRRGAVEPERLAEGDAQSRLSDASAERMLAAASDARLVLDDSFDDERIDSEAWMTLGAVEANGGAARLGVGNPERHIDTWHERPYLLTRREFDPAKRPVTIVGKATFDENFLNGYGGSFAVMTRAGDRHGSGVGWENSILDRGVRSNFWPASIEQNKNIELFEKPFGRPVSLLAAMRYEINPRHRSYYFRVVDDGRSATLTIVDAADPSRAVTATHATTADARGTRRIAFESCWGSPVALDDVKIFEQGSP